MTSWPWAWTSPMPWVTCNAAVQVPVPGCAGAGSELYDGQAGTRWRDGSEEACCRPETSPVKRSAGPFAVAGLGRMFQTQLGCPLAGLSARAVVFSGCVHVLGGPTGEESQRLGGRAVGFGGVGDDHEPVAG